MSLNKQMKPIGFFTSAAFFSIPAILTGLLVYVIAPILNGKGVSKPLIYIIIFIVPMILLFIISFITLKIERGRIIWPDMKDRFRLKRMSKRDWLYTSGLLIFIISFHYLLSFTPKALSKLPFFAPPQYVPPVANPNIENIAFQQSYLDIPLKDNWWVLIIFILIMFFNIIGEEFLWRGYILPRQELQYKNKAWLINGLLWNLSHICWRWNMVMILPGCLAIPFVSQKLKNTYPGIIVHTILNGFTIIPIIQGIIGV